MQVLKPARPSPLRSALETFASDGPIATAVSSTAELGVSQLPELFRSVMSPPRSAATASQVTAPKQTTSLPASTGDWQTTVCKIVRERTPAWATDACARLNVWWTRERVNKLVEASLPNRKLDALAIDGESRRVPIPAACSNLISSVFLRLCITR